MVLAFGVVVLVFGVVAPVLVGPVVVAPVLAELGAVVAVSVPLGPVGVALLPPFATGPLSGASLHTGGRTTDGVPRLVAVPLVLVALSAGGCATGAVTG